MSLEEEIEALKKISPEKGEALFLRTNHNRRLIPFLTGKQLHAILLLDVKPPLLDKYYAEERARTSQKQFNLAERELKISAALVLATILSVLITMVFTLQQIDLQKQINIDQQTFNEKQLIALDKLTAIQEQAQYRSWKIYPYFEDTDNDKPLDAYWDETNKQLRVVGNIAVYNIGTLPIVLAYYGELGLTLKCDNEEIERTDNAHLITDRNTSVLLTGENNLYQINFPKGYQSKPQSCILTARIKAQHPIDEEATYQDVNTSVRIV